MTDTDKTREMDEKNELETVENGYPSDKSDSHIGLDDRNVRLILP